MRTRLRAQALAAAVLVATVGSAQTPDQGAQVKPPPVPGGVVPLPTGPPQTGLQSPVPSPFQSLPGKPLPWSPDLAALKANVEKQSITLQQAISIALYTSRAFALSVAELQQAEGRTGQARAQLLPTLGANGQLSYYDQATVIAIGGGPPITVLPQFNPIYTAAFTLPIDVFGSLHAAVSQAQFSEVAARIDVNRVRNQVVYDVKTAFYGVLRAQAQVIVATDNLNNALTRLSDATKNYGAGTNSRFDVLTAQRDVSDAQQTLITAKAQVSVSLALLKNTIGLDLSTKMSVSAQDAVEAPADVPAGEPPAATTPITPVAAPDAGKVEDDFVFGPEYDALIKEALATRPDVLESEAQITAAKRGVQYARRSMLPSFSAGLDYVYTPNATFATRPHVGVATLTINVPVFDGGLARERMREAEGSEAAAVISRRTAADQVKLDVQQAYITLVQARQRVAVSNVELAQAREAFRVSRVRYSAGVSQQTGVSPQVELSNAQITLAQAESNHVNALYDYNNARAQLDRAVGRYAFTGSPPGYKSMKAAR